MAKFRRRKISKCHHSCPWKRFKKYYFLSNSLLSDYKYTFVYLFEADIWVIFFGYLLKYCFSRFYHTKESFHSQKHFKHIINRVNFEIFESEVEEF